MPFGTGHLPLLIMLLVVAVIIFGPGKLPELGSGMGKAIREFKHHTSDLRSSVMSPDPAPVPAPVVVPPSSADPVAASRDTRPAA
ncbi:MAG: sec-independent protein translocase protein TatA [Chloroflexota bacterium]|jgi:sec-independent protein translocase protein TatA|nr:sec-independent protein translocase protein TatA [Chloroflexota bacterium]